MGLGERIRIEASSRTHAESLQRNLDRYTSQLVREGQSWQVELEGEGLTKELLELLRVLGGWLETESIDSLKVHFDERTFTLLRPTSHRPPDSVGFLLERIAQLETALESRVLIEQAKGILSVRLDIDAGESFELLRSTARSNRVTLRDLCAEVVRTREVPSEISVGA